MKHYQSIEVQTDNLVLTIWLNRVEKRNAIDRQMVDDLARCLSVAADDDAVRVVVLRGRGGYFCAGGDLAWMGSGETLPEEDRPATLLARLFSFIYSFPKPLVAVVHGAALGGALGLVSTADFVLAEPDATFSFSELRLGLIPAVISPFVIRRIGVARARKLMLSASKLPAEEAERVGFVDRVVHAEEMEVAIADLCAGLISLAPKAMKACKKMLNRVSELQIDDELTKYTAGQLHHIQHGDEAREGVAAFFEKRRPLWNR
jgi:methylglutaconyl-CoA hydratase